MQEGEVRLGGVLDFWKHRDCAEKIALASDKVIFWRAGCPVVEQLLWRAWLDR